MNEKEYSLDHQPRLEKHHVLKACETNGHIHNNQTEERLDTIHDELSNGINFIDTYQQSVTFFGSARLPADNQFYRKAQNLAHRISKELGYAVVSGGGPGIMEAANRGAHEAGGDSVGFTIKLPREQSTNPYVNKEISFHYFFTRKVSMTYSAECFLYFPGGFGTMDELFEILTLVQTNKIAQIPIILVGREFWQPLDIFIKGSLLDTYKTISRSDLDLYTILDDEDKILEIIKNTTVRDGA